MSSSVSRSTWWLGIILTGIVSLVVGVSSGLFLDFFRSRGANLTYAVISSQRFAGETESTSIMAVEVANSGNREAEGVFCRVAVDAGRIQDVRIAGLPSSSYSESRQPAGIEVTVPFLNAGESFSVQLLLSSEAEEPVDPRVELRAKGVNGVPRAAAGEPDTFRDQVPLLAATAAMTLLSLAFAMLAARHFVDSVAIRFRKLHADDQRDITAYVLGAHGFREEGAELRLAARQLQYWSIVDHLTERWVAETDAETKRRGITVLTELLEYAAIAKSSEQLIRLNIARLACEIGDRSLASEQLAKASERRLPLIEARIAHDENLRSVAEKTEQANKR